MQGADVMCVEERAALAARFGVAEGTPKCIGARELFAGSVSYTGHAACGLRTGKRCSQAHSSTLRA